MKKMTCFVMALALVLGLAQCKKEQPQEPQGEKVRITLNVDGNKAADGTRADVTPPSVTFVYGDQILVASNGVYVGTLTKNGENFSGEITDPTEGQPLYFYFLGNKQGTLENGAKTCTVNISDQTTEAGLPVISMGKSTTKYSTSVSSYTSRLYNKCSLMKFIVDTPSTAPICITGMVNTVIVNFGNPTDSGFTYYLGDEGLIKMPAKDANNVTWAIVFPQPALTEIGEAYTTDGYTGIRPIMDEIQMNKFLDTGFSMTVNTAHVNVTLGGNAIGGWTNDGGDPWGGDAPGGDGNTLGGWNNNGNNPWGN